MSGALVWSASLGGGQSTDLSLADEVIFFGGNDNRLYAVTAGSGALVWSSGLGSGPSTDVTVVGVYVGSFNNRLYALRA